MDATSRGNSGSPLYQFSNDGAPALVISVHVGGCPPEDGYGYNKGIPICYHIETKCDLPNINPKQTELVHKHDTADGNQSSTPGKLNICTTIIITTNKIKTTTT